MNASLGMLVAIGPFIACIMGMRFARKQRPNHPIANLRWPLFIIATTLLAMMISSFLQVFVPWLGSQITTATRQAVSAVILLILSGLILLLIDYCLNILEEMARRKQI